MEQTVVINSCRVEETNEFRLALAEKVLVCATQCLEMEVTMHHAEIAHKEHKANAKKTGKIETPLPGAGGYH